MNNRTIHRMMAIGTAFVLFFPGLAMGNESQTNPSEEEILNSRVVLLEKFSTAADDVADEVRRRTNELMREKENFFRDFYDKKIGKLDSESKTEDGNIVYSLNSFLAEHPKDSKSPYALLKLAQIYFEEADGIYRRELENYKGGDDPPKKDLSLAIKTLEKIKNNFPSFEHADSVLYLLGWAYLGSPDPKLADPIYERLARQYPSSPYATEAFLRIGEHYFARRNFKKAAEAYQTVLKYPKGTLYDKALYKLAWSYYLMGDYDSSIKNFVALLELSPVEGEDTILKDFKNDAQMYIAFGLYRKGSVKNSIAFLESISAKPYAYKINKDLGDIYNDRDLFPEAVRIYRDLVARHPLNGENPAVTTSLIVSLEKLRADKEIKNEWRNAFLAFRPGSRWRAKNFEKEANSAADTLLENSLYSLAIELDKTGRQEKNFALINEAIDLYAQLVSYFPKSEKSYNAQHYAGEAYLFLDKPEKALAAYDQVLKNNYFSRYYSEALYSEIIIYERMLGKKGGLGSYKVDEKTASQEILDLPSKLLSACDHFIDKVPEDGRVPQVMYYSADILEHFLRIEPALKRYSYILQKYRSSPFAKDSLRRILNIHTRKEDYLNVAEVGGNYLKAPYFDDQKLTEEVCSLVAYAQYNIGRNLEKEGKHLEASRYLRAVAREFPKSETAKNSIIAAFESLVRSEDYREATLALEEILRENPESPILPRILFELALRADKGLNFEKANSYYEKILVKHPQSPESKEALLKMAMLAEIEEEYSKAGDLYLSYAKTLPPGELNREAILKAVINYREANLCEKILDKELVFTASLKVDDLKLAYLFLVISEYHQKNNSRLRSTQYLDLALKSLNRSSSATPETDDILSKIRMGLAQKQLDEFKNMRLSFPQKRFISALEKKAGLLENLENTYLSFIKEGTPSVSSQALYHLAEAYENFGRSILDIKIPDTSDPAQNEALKKELANIGEPLLTKARSAYMKNIRDSKERKYFNAWIKSSVERFSSMIESQNMLPPLILDYRYRFDKGIYVFPLITDANYPKAEDRPKSSLAVKLFEEGISLIDKTDEKLEVLRRASFLFGEAYRLDPSFKAARFNKAFIMQKLGNYDVAQFIYHSIEKDPSYRDMVKANMASVYLGLDNIDKAIEAYNDILDEKPGETDIMSNLAYAYRLKGEDGSLKLSRDILESKPMDERAYNNIAMAYLDRGKTKTAKRILERLIENGKGVIAPNNLAVINIIEGDYGKAYARLSEIVKESPGDRTALSNTVHILLKTQNYEEGLSFARNLWENYGDNGPELYLNLGFAYISLQKNREAIDHMNANLRFAGPYGKEAKSIISSLNKIGGE